MIPINKKQSIHYLNNDVKRNLHSVKLKKSNFKPDYSKMLIKARKTAKNIVPFKTKIYQTNKISSQQKAKPFFFKKKNNVLKKSSSNIQSINKIIFLIGR